MKQFEVINEPIATEQYRQYVLNEHQGAVVIFTGHVREWTQESKQNIWSMKLIYLWQKKSWHK